MRTEAVSVTSAAVLQLQQKYGRRIPTIITTNNDDNAVAYCDKMFITTISDDVPGKIYSAEIRTARFRAH
jgi:hypothetical protein